MIDTKNVLVARELHIIRAHLLHYGSLLTDFRKSVQFIFDTRHPAIVSYPEEIQKGELELLQRECDTLLSEIERLEQFRHMQDKRMQNAIDLVSLPLITRGSDYERCTRLSALSIWKIVNVHRI